MKRTLNEGLNRNVTRTAKLALAIALVGVAATATGCFRRVPIEDATKSHTVTKRIAAGEASSTVTRISYGAGEFELAGSDIASDAVVGDFTFSPNTLEPVLTGEVDSDGVLRAKVDQPDVLNVPPADLGGPVNINQRWNVKLSNALPTELDLNMGAGEAKVDLTDVDITDLELTLGAGSTTIDLSGPRMHAVTGKIQAGAGEIVVRLPKDLPVRVFGNQDGIGEFTYDSGFSKDGNELTNDAWRVMQDGATDYKGSIELKVQHGIGEVRLELVE